MLAIVIALVVGLIVGVWQGFRVAVIGIPGFVPGFFPRRRHRVHLPWSRHRDRRRIRADHPPEFRGIARQPPAQHPWLVGR